MGIVACSVSLAVLSFPGCVSRRMNVSESFSLDERFRTQIMVFLVLDSIVALSTIVGNSIFMMILALKHSLHTPPNILLGALCLSDLLVGTVVQPLYLSEFSCKLAGVSIDALLTLKTILTWFCVGLSYQHIFLISLDRYAALCHPFLYHSYATCRLHVRICLLTSIIPLSVTTTSIILLVTHNLTIRNYILSGLLLVSFVAVAFANWRIFVVLLYRKRKVVVVGEIAGENRRHETSKGRQERNKTYVIVIVLVLFFICYLPLFIQFILKFWQEEVFTSFARFQAFDLWTDFFMLLNSAVNPLVYYVRMKEMRKAAFDILCRRRCNAVNQEYVNTQTY